MSVFVVGGTGFIGRRLIPLLAGRGEEIVCMDINPQTADYSQFGKQVRVVRGDISQFDDLMARITEAKPARIVNLANWRANHRLTVCGGKHAFAQPHGQKGC